MKVLKIDHLGIAVNSIEEAKRLFQDTLGLEFEGTETVEEQKVTTAFFPVGDSEVELLESTAPDGPIAKYLEKRGEGIQHIAFRVEDIEQALKREVAEEIGISQPAASRHLIILRDRGMVTAQREGQSVIYHLADDRTIKALDLLRSILADNLKSRGDLADSVLQAR